MAFVLKDGQGTLFRNDKDGNDKRPDYRGELVIDGRTYELSGWVKEGNKGKWVSLSARPKAAAEKDRRTEAQKYRDKDVDPDSLPF